MDFVEFIEHKKTEKFIGIVSLIIGIIALYVIMPTENVPKGYDGIMLFMCVWMIFSVLIKVGMVFNRQRPWPFHLIAFLAFFCMIFSLPWTTGMTDISGGILVRFFLVMLFIGWFVVDIFEFGVGHFLKPTDSENN